METESATVSPLNLIRIFAREQPFALAEGKFQLVAVEFCLFRGKCRENLGVREIQMAYAQELVFNLTALCLQLHRIRKRLPFAAAAHTEMLAERLESVLGSFNDFGNQTLHIIVFLFANLHVHNVSGHGKRHEQSHIVHVRNGFPFSRNSLYLNVVKYDFLLVSTHWS